MRQYAKPESSHTAVNKAGIALRDVSDWGLPQFDADLGIVSNWRSSHEWPLLALRVTLEARSKKVDSIALVAQRLKRLPSIMAKLHNERTMKLSQMQDIGGLRTIVSDVQRVHRLAALHLNRAEQNPDDVSELFESYDYIKSPKNDGYRGIHLVYKYKSRFPEYQIYKDHRIEIQLRSRLQHLWATALETAQTFTRKALRSTSARDPWNRFFILISQEFSQRENSPGVAGAPSDKQALVEELRNLVRELRLEVVMPGWVATLQRTPQIRKLDKRAAYFVLMLDPEARKIRAKPYRKDQFKEANDEYLAQEKTYLGKYNVVLVSVGTLKDTRRAYPNYWLRTNEFLSEVRRAI